MFFSLVDYNNCCHHKVQENYCCMRCGKNTVPFDPFSVSRVYLILIKGCIHSCHYPDMDMVDESIIKKWMLIRNDVQVSECDHDHLSLCIDLELVGNSFPNVGTSCRKKAFLQRDNGKFILTRYNAF
jgi:hypothetical protein